MMATFAWGTGQAVAAHVSCGDTVTTDTTLDSDLVDCANGLTIAADNVTLDLGGHTIAGPGPGQRHWPLPDFDVVGVRIRGANATVRGGSVTGFGLSVLAQETRGATITDITAAGSYYGIYLYKSNGNRVEHNLVRDNVYGLHLQEANDNQLLDNELAEQTHHSPGGYGLYLYASQRNRIEFNTVRDNLNWGLWFSESIGNTIVHNNVSGNSPQVSDDSGGNVYYDEATREGNYWAEYQGADANGDGIGDTPYTIGGPGRLSDLYPFMAANGWQARAEQTLAPATPPAAPPSPPRAYVALADGSVAAVDPVNNTLLASWQVGVTNSSLSTSFDGTRLYAIAGDAVLALDTASGAVVGNWHVPGATVLAAMYNGERVIVGTPEGIVEIVLATNDLLPEANGAAAVSLTPSWKHNLVLAATANAELDVIYLPNKHSPYQMQLDGAPLQTIDNRAGTRLFALLAGQPDAQIIDTEQFVVTERVPLDAIDPTQARLAPSPDGTTLYVLDRANARVIAIDLGTQRVIHELRVDGQAVDLAVSGDGAYVTIAVAGGATGRAVLANRDLAPLGSVELSAAPLSVAAPR
jgi:parallel beta-helix repeat protein